MTAVSYNSKTDVLTGQFMLALGGIPVAYAKKATLEVSRDKLDTSNKMSGDWNTYIPGKGSFTISSDQLLTHLTGAVTAQTLIDAIISKSTYEFIFGEFTETAGTDPNVKTYALDTTKESYTGTVIPTKVSIESESGALASSSATFDGTGALVPTAAVAA